LLTDFKNTFYEFGTLLYCFNEAHTISVLDCQSSKCPPVARMQARRRALHQLRSLNFLR